MVVVGVIYNDDYTFSFMYLFLRMFKDMNLSFLKRFVLWQVA